MAHDHGKSDESSKGLEYLFSKLNLNHGFYIPQFTMPDKDDHLFSPKTAP
jgi:hypothetical protein